VSLNFGFPNLLLLRFHPCIMVPHFPHPHFHPCIMVPHFPHLHFHPCIMVPHFPHAFSTRIMVPRFHTHIFHPCIFDAPAISTLAYSVPTIESSRYCRDVCPSVCLFVRLSVSPSICLGRVSGMHCDHMVHFSTI